MIQETILLINKIVKELSDNDGYVWNIWKKDQIKLISIIINKVLYIVLNSTFLLFLMDSGTMQDFLMGKTILVTGATGFLAKGIL
jgi:hypothetical protein